MQAKIRVRLHREGSGTHDVAKMKKNQEEAMTKTHAEKKSDDRSDERTNTSKTHPRKTWNQAKKSSKGRHIYSPRKVPKENSQAPKSAPKKTARPINEPKRRQPGP